MLDSAGTVAGTMEGGGRAWKHATIQLTVETVHNIW